MTDQRYRPEVLVDFSRQLFAAAGCDDGKPEVISRYLVEADLMGHTTHGLAQAADYLDDLKSGRMRARGKARVISDHGAAVTWDGDHLPGVWLMVEALDFCMGRARAHGTCSLAIRRSHHIACLAAFLPRATDAGLMAIIATSDPSAASVAPFGGLSAVFTPDPLAVGIPTETDPILIDISSSITTNGMTARLRKEGRRFPGDWALSPTGTPSDDPAILDASPPGTLLPVGGLDHGHKGYGMALTVEALTQALPGFGRADKPESWGGSVFIQLLDPEAFGGRREFLRQTSWLADRCRASKPIAPDEPVRLPGERALRLKRNALANGLAPYPGILESLAPWAEAYQVPLPQPLAPMR
jgi:LDH2 family malate/lactate/ureidoglycolate dehydrogenase